MRDTPAIVVTFGALTVVCTRFDPNVYCSMCVNDTACSCTPGNERLDIKCDGQHGANCVFPILYTDADICSVSIPISVYITIQNYCFETLPSRAIKLKSSEPVFWDLLDNMKLGSFQADALALLNANLHQL